MADDPLVVRHRANHDAVVASLIKTAAAQVRVAYELGVQATMLSMSEADNPFKKVIGHPTLAASWSRGLVNANIQAGQMRLQRPAP